MRSCNNFSRILVLFSVLLLCHAATVTRKLSDPGGHRYLEGQSTRGENNFDDERNDNDAFQQQSFLVSNLDTILQMMDPPSNCTALDTTTPNSLFDNDTPGTQQHHNRLECFLWNLKVEIPEQSFEKGWVTITVHDMVCTNFRLHGLLSNSSHASMMSQETHDWSSLKISVQTVSATCQGRYHSTGGLAGNVLATVEQSSPPPSQALELLVGVKGKGMVDNNNSSQHQNSNATMKLPSSFETKKCETRLGCSAIRFSGSISAKMIQAFSGRIGKYITKALQEQVCPLMTKIVDPIVTAYLKEFDDLIQPYLKEGNDSIISRFNPIQNDDTNLQAKDLNEFPAISSILSFLNEQLRYHLQKGWIPLPPPSFHGGDFHRMSQKCIDSFRGISGWIISFLGPRPRIRLPQNLQHIVFPIPEEIGRNGTISLYIPEVEVEGLDEMDALQVLSPPSSESKDLNTKLVSQKGFSVVLPIDLEIQWPALHGSSSMEVNDASVPPTLRESFQLTINVTHIDATLSSLIEVVDWESISLLQVIDSVEQFVESRNLADLACLFRTLHNIQLSNDGSFIFHNILIDAIRLSRDRKEVPDGSLEADFDHTINTILDLFLADYADLWTRLVRGLVRGPGSRSLNRFVQGWIEKHSSFPGDTHDGKCAPATRSPGHWVNFTKFEILNTFNQYLDHSHTLHSLNDFLVCLAEGIEEAIDGDSDPAYYPVTDSNELDVSKESSGGVAPFYIDDSIVTSSSLDLSETIFDILKDGMNLFVESGNSLSIQHDDTATKVTLSRVELRNWDSIQRLQIMKPSGDNSLVSSLAYGTNVSLEDVEEGDPLLVWTGINTMEGSVSSSKGPPEIALVIDVSGNKFSGQANLTLFGSLNANAEINIDYDLNRLENLTISHLFEEIDCALLPAMQIRLLPGTTNLAFGEYFGANVTAAISGRDFSMSTKEFPRFSEISNDGLSWFEEFSRTMGNLAVEKLIESSTRICPGVVAPDDDHQSNEGKSIDWLWGDSGKVWFILGLLVAMQGGLVFIYRSQQQEVNNESIHTGDSEEVESASGSMPLLSSYQELMSHPTAETIEGNPDIKQNNSIDEHIIRDICNEWNDEPQGILEDQLVEETPQVPKISLFESDKIPDFVKYLIPIMVIGTIILFLCSNMSIGASVDLSVELGQRSIGIPGLFQFSLGNTVSEMYSAGIYPLLFLVLSFSGIWPYVKLLVMLYSWMTPSSDQHQQERRLLTLDAMGKYSLVDNYVLILFVVAFRFHLAITDNLGIDVYVTPVYGFFSFLFATCLSLILGHAVLFFHRKTMQLHDDDGDIDDTTKTLMINHGFNAPDMDSRKRLSRFAQGLILLSAIATMGFLLWGFFQESYTFEIGGLAGMMLGEDMSKSSYSVLSLGAALPSSVEDPQSQSIIFLQGTFFFFTLVTPILCLILILVLLATPLTLKWQRYLLVAAEIANSWSAVEVFLLSILAALFQISTFASFMIGDKCDEINILAKKIFDEKDTDTVCFTVDASVESNCWYLLVGAVANIFLVSFCLGFAETAVEEKVEESYRRHEPSSSEEEAFPETKRRNQTLIQKLLGIPLVSCILFAPIPGSSSLAPEEDAMPPLENQQIDTA